MHKEIRSHKGFLKASKGFGNFTKEFNKCFFYNFPKIHEGFKALHVFLKPPQGVIIIFKLHNIWFLKASFIISFSQEFRTHSRVFCAKLPKDELNITRLHVLQHHS